MSRYYDDELYHYGILGMRWGVRRFQNQNGSLTPAGRRRYYTGEVHPALLKVKSGFDAYKHAVKSHTAGTKEYAERHNVIRSKHKEQIKEVKEKLTPAGKKVKAGVDAYVKAVKSHTAGTKEYAERHNINSTTNKEQTNSTNTNLTLSPRQKTAIKVGAAVVATGLAVYGGHQLFKGKHNPTRVAAQKLIGAGKQAAKNTLKKGGNYAVEKLKAMKKEGKHVIKTAPGEAWKSIKEGAKKGASDAAKIAGTGMAVYAIEKRLERKYGKEKAKKIIDYGRKPFPKK